MYITAAIQCDEWLLNTTRNHVLADCKRFEAGTDERDATLLTYFTSLSSRTSDRNSV